MGSVTDWSFSCLAIVAMTSAMRPLEASEPAPLVVRISGVIRMLLAPTVFITSMSAALVAPRADCWASQDSA